MEGLEHRIAQAVESILENESLTADLDDAAAKELLDWGTACARRIARDTVGLGNMDADESMSPRLRAVRRLMRQINGWIARQTEMDAEARVSSLAQVVEQAVIIYETGFTPPALQVRDAFLQQQLGDPAQMIADLRKLIEDSIFSNGGGKNGQDE